MKCLKKKTLTKKLMRITSKLLPLTLDLETTTISNITKREFSTEENSKFLT